MEKPRWVYRLALLVAISLVVSACGGIREPAPDQTVPGHDSRRFDEVAESDVPEALRQWVQDQYDNRQPAHKEMTVGDATYIAVTAGQKPTGGYTIEALRKELPTPGGKPVAYLDLRLVPPKPGALVTQALTNPVRYFRITPLLAGDVEVQFK